MSAVFPFLLPDLPVGKVVIDAKFSANLETTNSNLTGHLDVYGLNTRTAANVLVTDGFAGTYPDVNATGIQENFADKNTSTGIVNLTTARETQLIAYLNGQYAAANTGD